MPTLRVAFIASEVAPFAKTGGLADVAGALPPHLHARGIDVRVFMPLHATAVLGGIALTPVSTAQNVPVRLGTTAFEFSLLEGRLPGSAVPIYFVECPEVFDRPTVYTIDPDEHLRFLVLQRAALDGCQRLQFAPDILHCHDWHTGLVPLLLKTAYAWDALFARTRTVLTIHNIGYQGAFPLATTQDLGTSIAGLLSPEDTARGEVNWLREGLRLADRVSTVSPTYAWEITTPEGGHGLDATLRARPDGVVGILNGVDYEQWNPATDRYLQHRYSATDLAGKAATKRDLLQFLNVDLEQATPLIGVVSRLTIQKGFDLLFDSLPQILTTRKLAMIVLGSGEPRYEQFFRELHQRFADRVIYHHGYNEELAHLIEAGSDMFLMPSMYEPCGLNQMYSLKYGTVPIVRKTGGLADTVQLWNPGTRTGTGIVFDHYDARGVSWAIHTGLDLFKDKNSWGELVRNGMAQDFSWPKAAAAYEKMYREL
ncbi:MAG TPA: glycogen synthase [Steroidobacteraceae bacterium]|nr:glycogen synthase [Steroidobacteraceae bacterium]